MAPIMRLVFFIATLLFLIPFFWFPAGAMDIGGDGNRLYYYDPIAFIKNTSLYSMEPEGKALVDPTKHAYLPYVGLFAVIKYFHVSSHDLISIFNGIKLSVGFISIYFIVKEFLQRGEKKERNFYVVEMPSILAGVFYILATGSEKLIFHWVKALHSHDQVFLNPLLFLLVLRYLLTQNRWYMVGALLVSFIFSTNFAMISAPPFFAFYPIALVFLLLYVTFIRKVKIQIKEIAFGMALFLGLHAFHLVPELLAVFKNNSVATSVVFKESGVNYFTAIRGLGLASVSLFVPSPVSSLRWVSFMVPLVIILGGLQSWRKNKEILLISIFFFITFFLVTANITFLGIELYRKLFLIPGFSMFRNFYLQWAYIFIFFYALLFGESLALIFSKLSKKFITLISVGFIVLSIIGFWPFLSGQLVDGIQWGSNGVKTAMVIDPQYEQTLSFIKRLPDEGKILVLPLTDNYIQVLFGINNAAYVGPATIPFLTGKKSFAGYQNFWPDPIPEEIMRYSRENNYEALNQIFSLFNIRYIFHNSDPKIYEEKFPQFPNSYMMTSLPKTQKEYKDFVQKFPVHFLYNYGPFELYEFESRVYRKEVYIPDSLYKEDMLQVIRNKKISFQSAFIDQDECQKNEIIRILCKDTYKPPEVSIETRKINPTRYMIQIKQSEDPLPFLLVFQNGFHSDWKLSFDQEKVLSEDKHFMVNKYANGWIITKDDRKGRTNYTLYLDLVTQRYFGYGLWITGVSLFILFIIILRSFINRK